MEARNPYAVSSATLRVKPGTPVHSADEEVWRDGKVLVMKPDAELPFRCVKCGGPCEHPIKQRKVYWHHWAIYLVLLLNVIIYAIVAAVSRRKATVAPGLCARHKTQRRLAIFGAWIGGLVFLFVMGAGISNGSPVQILLGLLLIFGSIFYGMTRGRLVWAQHINEEYVRLRGCAPSFLETLPRFPG